MKLLVVLLGLLFVLPGAVRAQAELYRNFMASGHEHLIRYINAKQSYVQPIVQAIEESLVIYQPMWDSTSTRVPFNIVVEVRTDVGDQNQYADAELVPPSQVGGSSRLSERTDLICSIAVFDDAALESARILRTVIAHEIAHCYQGYYIVAMRDTQDDDTHKWWVEGSAEWLASFVYPENMSTYLDVTGVHSAFIEEHENNSTFTLHYDAVYFWEFLASPAGLGSTDATLALLRQLTPTLASNYTTFLQPHITDSQFHQYSLSVAQQGLPYLPTADSLLQSDGQIDSLPQTWTVRMEDFAINLSSLVMGVDTHGRVLQITPTLPAGVTGSLFDGARIIPLTNGTPTSVCLHQGESILLVYSRTTGTSLGEAQVDFSQGSSTCLPTCIAGTWDIGTPPNLPPNLQGFTYEVGEGGYQISFYADGDWIFIADLTLTIEQASTMVMELDALITGMMSVEQNAAEADRYDVVSGTSQLDPSSTLSMTMDSTVMDGTPFLSQIFASTFAPASHFVCISENELQFLPGGTAAPWVLTRGDD